MNCSVFLRALGAVAAICAATDSGAAQPVRHAPQASWAVQEAFGRYRPLVPSRARVQARSARTAYASASGFPVFDRGDRFFGASPSRRPRYHGARHFSGGASYYWRGQRVASGGRFNPHGLTAAHRTLPFGTRVRVMDRNTGRSVVVTINDRGPFVRGRVLDLSLGAAKVLGMTGRGVINVSAEVL